MAINNSLLARLSGGLCLAVLAAAFSFGGSSALRAADEALEPTMQEMFVAPIMRAMEGIAERLIQIESSVSGLTESLTTRRIVVQEICLADASGAQTCITKGDLDSLLRKVAQAETSQPTEVAAEPAVASESESVAVAEPEEAASIEEPTTTAEVEPEASPAAEPIVVAEPNETPAAPAGEQEAAAADPAVVEVEAEIIQTVPASEPTVATMASVQDVQYTASIPQPEEAAAPVAEGSETENPTAEDKPITEEEDNN